MIKKLAKIVFVSVLAEKLGPKIWDGTKKKFQKTFVKIREERKKRDGITN